MTTAIQARRVQRVIVFSHIVGLATWLGATVLLGVLIETVGQSSADAFGRRRRFAEIFQVYNPVAIGALGVVVVTGGWALTPYKQALGSGYFASIGGALIGKLALAFLLIMMATWITFGICHRVVRANQGALPVTDAGLDGLVRRLRYAIWLTVIAALATYWVALGINPPAIP